MWRKILNTITDQTKGAGSNLSPLEWNQIINILKKQANNNTEGILKAIDLSIKPNGMDPLLLNGRLNPVYGDEAETYILDTTTTDVNMTLYNYLESTYKANLTKLVMNIPRNIEIGYLSIINFKTSGSELPLSIINNSAYQLKIMRYNSVVDELELFANKIYNLIFHYDGFFIYLYYKEVNNA